MKSRFSTDLTLYWPGSGVDDENSSLKGRSMCRRSVPEVDTTYIFFVSVLKTCMVMMDWFSFLLLFQAKL